MKVILKLLINQAKLRHASRAESYLKRNSVYNFFTEATYEVDPELGELMRKAEDAQQAVDNYLLDKTEGN